MSIAWNEENAAHLLGRTGFAALPGEVEASLKLGRTETVRRLVDGIPLTGSPFKPLPMEKVAVNGKPLSMKNIGDAQLYWLYRMMNTTSPLIERMVLFWHGHFATSYKKVRSVPLMMRQNELFRQKALGNMHELVQAVSKDPAMMIWLDANSNRKGKANENYAREVMELFTLGIGHYTEPDIKAAARALTGWRVDRATGKVRFVPRLHDGGNKTILGRTGDWDEAGFIQILFQQPALYRFMAGKVLSHFAMDPPSDAWVSAVAADMAKQPDLKTVMVNLLNSEEFYQPAHRLGLVRSPAEYLVGKARALQLPLSRSMIGMMRKMGQELYEPPNVAGWPGGAAWLTTSGLLARYQIAQLAGNKAKLAWLGPAKSGGVRRGKAGKAKAVTAAAVNVPAKTPDEWVAEAGQSAGIWQWSDSSKAALKRYASDAWGNAHPDAKALRTFMQLVLMSPESSLV